MRVLVTGATGFLGRALIAALRRRGDEVIALTRDVATARQSLPDGATAATWSRAADYVAHADAVVNLAGEPIAGRWTAAKMHAIRESRMHATRALTDAIASAPKKPKVLVSTSAIGVYGETFEETDESAPAGKDFLAQVCVDWEAEADRAVRTGVRVAKLRVGLVLGRGGVLERLLPLFRAGLGGPIGSGKQWWSWVHVDDVVAAYRAALDDARFEGPINVVSPNPATQRDFARTLGEVVRRPAVVPTPAFALRVALGDGAGPILTGQRVVPRRALALGFEFVHPVLREALEHAISHTSGTDEVRDRG